MSLVFTGSYTEFHRQYFKMVEIMTHHFEQNMHGLNPHARPYVPTDSREEGSVENDAVSEEENDIKTQQHQNKKSINNDKLTHEGRIFRSIRKNEPNLKIEKAKIINTNKYDVLNDLEIQECAKNNEKVENLQELKNIEKKNEPYHVDNVEMHVLDKTIKTFVDEEKNSTDGELKEEIEVINNACSDVTNVLLCRFYEDCSRMSKDFEEADQSLMQLCTMHSDLKERFKKREKQWIQKVTELLEKCALLEKDYDEQIDDASLNDNQDVIETLPHVIANMPQSLVNDIMSEQIFSDESSSSIESCSDDSIYD